MSRSTDASGREKDALMARCALARQRLREQAQGLQLALGGQRTAVAIAASPATRWLIFSAVFFALGRARAVRLIALAQGIMAVRRVVTAALGAGA